MRRSLVAVFAVAALSTLAVWRLQAQPFGARGPAQPFSEAAAPPAPDYANPNAWAAWPGRPSNADAAPDGVARIDPARAKVDVFFIHPTTYLASEKWNAAYDEAGRATTGVDNGVLANQASAFNGCCRIYAPRYRQAALAAFTQSAADREPAIDLAYQDVARAFEFYIAHENKGRPFIIASHSQGSLHALRLLQQKIVGTPLARRLVAAYVIGGFTPVEIERAGLPICRSATQTRCIITWNSVTERGIAARRRDTALMWLDGRYQAPAGHDIVCVNPLTWQADAAAPASANLGALSIARPGEGKLVPGLTGAACNQGMLVVDVPASERLRFIDPLSIVGIYHDLDYNLYYLNIRKNAAERVDAFLSRRQ
ncbi:MAG TPA: DUF3089 domain-containing protein [Caulobacteraceae bacterium]|nr:DUF3089 domain-containing protein [Caulobacteraceae bacterium]